MPFVEHTMEPYLPQYQAPELLFDKNPYYTEKIDIWAAGLVIYQLYSNGAKLFPSKETLCDDVRAFFINEFVLVEFPVWRRMMHVIPKRRINAAEAYILFF